MTLEARDLLVVLAAAVALAVATWRGWPTRRLGVVLALVAMLQFVGPWASRWSTGWVQTWNVFHYTVGARFFPELGYHDLYLGALAADAASDTPRFDGVRTVRDLHTYREVSRASALRGWELEDHLSGERIAELQAVIAALGPTVPESGWRDVFVDRGYNATPPYTAIAGRLAAALPSERPWPRWVSTVVDPLVLTAGLVAIGAAFGAESAAGVLLLLAVFPGTQGRWLGGFLEYDWLAALLLGLAATRAGRPGPAALAFAWATASRLFPAALVVSLLLPDLRALWRDRRPSGFARVFVPGYAALLAGFGLLGCTTARGPAAWAEFVPRFLFHSERHVVGRQRIGLRHLLLGRTAEDLRDGVAEAQTGVWLGVAAVGLAAWAFAASRRSRVEAAVLGFVPVFLLAVSSRYYWAGFALVGALPGLGGRGPTLGFLAACAAGYGARLAGLEGVGLYLPIEVVLAATLAAAVLAASLAPPVDPAGEPELGRAP